MSKAPPKKSAAAMSKIPKKNKDESAEAFLARLDKAKPPKPVKRDYDIKRQKVAAMEKACRMKVDKIVEQIKEARGKHKDLEGEFTVIKQDPIFGRFREQLSNAVGATNKLKEHRAQENALKDKKRDLRKVLGKYKNLQEVDRDIDIIRKNIEGGLYGNLKDERAAIKQMKKLNRLRADAAKIEGLDNQIDQLKQGDAYKADQASKKDHDSALKDIKQEKREKEMDKSSARTKMNEAWGDFQTLRTKKNELIDQAKEYGKKARDASNKYRTVERQYENFMQVYRRAEEAARRERIQRKRRERELEENEHQAAAMEALGGPRRMPDDPARNNKTTPKSNNGQAQRSRGTPQQGQGGRQDSDGPGKEKPKRLYGQKLIFGKKKEKEKNPEGEPVPELDNMKDIVIPFHDEIEQFEALEGYLRSLMPRAPPPESKQQPERRRKKKRKKKTTGAIKHNLNWLNAFSNASCSSLLPNRREKVEECFKELSAKLAEWREKSKASIEKRAGKAQKTADKTAEKADEAQQKQEAPAAAKAEPAADAPSPDQEKAVEVAASAEA